MQDGVLKAGGGTVPHVYPFGLFVLFEVMGQRRFGLRESIGDEGVIDLDRRFVSKLSRQPSRGFGSPGIEQNTGDGLIETMDNAQEDVPGLVVLLLEVSFGIVDRRRLARRRPLRGNASGLVDRNEVVVFEEGVHEKR